MGRVYGPLVALYTAFSVSGLAWRMNSTLHRARQHTGLLPEDALQHAQTARLLQSLFQSSLTTALFANLVVNFFILVALFAKALFFGWLSLMETQKLVERLINYVIFKGLFLALIAQPDIMQIALWLVWFAVLGFLKMFQGLARDRLERLNASPAATLFSHMRVFAVLVLVLLSDLFWIQLCLLIFKDNGISTLFLLLFEPLSIAFETLQAVLVHGMQLLDTWHRHISDVAPQCTGLQPLERSAAGAAWEWRGTVVRNCSFIMDILSLLLALGHCLHIWWLRGLAFQVVDGVLFLNLRALLSAILKRIKGFMRVRTATNTLQGALPDASHEELLAYEDDCAICKEPMARAKRLPCAHLFHLPCLRSWLDQGLAETYSCPTCRRPLFMRSARTASSLQGGQQFLDGDHMARAVNGLGQPGSDDPHILGDTSRQAHPNPLIGSFARQQWNVALNNTWRSSEIDPVWDGALPVGLPEGDGSSTESGTRGLRHMQAMMRQLIGGGRSHTHNEASESSRSWWPFANRTEEINSAQLSGATTSRRALFATGFQNHNGFQGFRNRGLVNAVNARDPHMGAMVSMVREVLPDIPEDIIIQMAVRLLVPPSGMKILARSACVVGGLVFPVYSSFKAIQLKDTLEQEHWLLYWTAYGCFSAIETFSDKLLSWLPGYYHAKLVFLIWLQLPLSNGARHILTGSLCPSLLKYQAVLDGIVNGTRRDINNFLVAYLQELRFITSVIQKLAQYGTGGLHSTKKVPSHRKSSSALPTGTGDFPSMKKVPRHHKSSSGLPTGKDEGPECKVFAGM